VVLALASGLTRVGEDAIDALVQVKRAIPTLALIPLLILWLGIGQEMKIAVIATSVLAPATTLRLTSSFSELRPSQMWRFRVPFGRC
jgi:ABC-type nitrate/sulfonate/bicarbonate transport system permease component